MAEFGSTFVLSISTLLITATAGCMAYALRSKCTSVRLCCGFVEIQRDVQAEITETGIIMHTATEPGSVNAPPPPPRLMNQIRT